MNAAKAFTQVEAGCREIYRIPPKQGGALARQSKDTRMWVHLFHPIGGTVDSSEATLWLHGVLIARFVIGG
jgi:hypothetical protein